MRRAVHILSAAVLVSGAVASSGTPARAAFPGKDGLVAFSTDRDGNFEIYTVKPDGTEPTRLTDDPGADTEPAWSPDGTRIAFVSTRDGNPEIYVMNADGTEPMRLTDHPAADTEPAWSRDGTRIAFVSTRDGNPEIYVMNADGTEPTRLTNHLGADTGPAWSPDPGQLSRLETEEGVEFTEAIAFARAEPDGPNLYLIDPTNPAQAPFLVFNDGTEPSWTSNGKNIGFTRDQDLYSGSPVSRIASRLGFSSTSAGEGQPAHSPEGGRVVFTRDQDIYRADLSAKTATALVGDPSIDRDPDWQPLVSRVDMAIALNRQGPYQGDDVINDTGQGQGVRLRLAQGSKGRIFIQVQGEGSGPGTYALRGPGGFFGIDLTYKTGGEDVTGEVAKGTLSLELAPGDSQVIKLLVAVGENARVGTKAELRIFARSSERLGGADTVKAKVLVRKAPG